MSPRTPHPHPEPRPRPEPETDLEDAPQAPGVPPMRVPSERARREEVEGWAEKLVRLLDDGLRVPGTDFRIGLDGILGFFLPGVGDVATGAGSLSLLGLAIKHKVPTVILARMVLNIGIDTLVGTVPFVGDLFDLFWKANRKNLELIQKYRDEPDAEPGPADYALVGVAVLLVVASIGLPILVGALLGLELAKLFG